MLLADSRVDVNAQDSGLLTPLHWALKLDSTGIASKTGKATAVRLLLSDARVDDTLRDKVGFCFDTSVYLHVYQCIWGSLFPWLYMQRGNTARAMAVIMRNTEVIQAFEAERPSH